MTPGTEWFHALTVLCDQMTTDELKQAHAHIFQLLAAETQSGRSSAPSGMRDRMRAALNPAPMSEDVAGTVFRDTRIRLRKEDGTYKTHDEILSQGAALRTLIEIDGSRCDDLILPHYRKTIDDADK